jgi:DNA helicase-2/ATP-dependent DNA helicase PcrA
VVGDASQTIYSFAGATPDYLLGFGAQYEDATVIPLEQNYRSTTQIIETANRLMRGRQGALTLVSASETAGTVPTVNAYSSDSSEARAVANSIAEEIAAGTPAASIAVLYRINVQGQMLETALNDAGVTYQLRGGTRFFDLREVKEVLMLLKGAAVNTATEPLFKTVSDVLRSIGWTQDPPETRGAVRDRWESLNALMGLAEESAPGTTLKEFVAELFERQTGQHEPTMAAVTLATLHSAKGLEWDSVYLVGLSEGLVPISYAKDFDAIDEERRLLYVGITRARRKLALSWAAEGQGRGGVRQPSRFLQELSIRNPGAQSTPAD